MDLNAVMDEIATELDTMTGLRVHGHPPASITPPAGVVSYPERVAYDQTYGRGMDRIERLPVILLAGKATDRAARDKVAGWAAGSGAGSVKAVLEANEWTSCHTVVVTECTFDVVTIAGVDYLAAMFDLDIAGAGSS
jgi:hypothetical protein